MDGKEKDVLLLEQEFKIYREITDKAIIELKRITEEQEAKIIQLEKNNTKTDIQYEQIMQILNKLNDTTIPGLISQIEELKNKPVRRYESIVGSILGAIFGAVGGAIAGLLLRK